MVQLGEPDTGLWCRRCAEDSLVRFPVLKLSGDGLMPIGSLDRCLNEDCDVRVNRRIEP